MDESGRSEISSTSHVKSSNPFFSRRARNLSIGSKSKHRTATRLRRGGAQPAPRTKQKYTRGRARWCKKSSCVRSWLYCSSRLPCCTSAALLVNRDKSPAAHLTTPLISNIFRFPTTSAQNFQGQDFF
ncbi:unnamed protein product [Pylaiella littoralis]